MDGSRINAAVVAIEQDFAIEQVRTAAEREEVFRLRYQVYCVERHFEPGDNGRETDEFDPVSRHVLLRHLPSGQAIGTVRLVIPRLGGPGAELPMERVAALPRLRHMHRNGIAEVSRFALSKSNRSASLSLGCLLRLALIRGIVQLSGEFGITAWCALMEPTLLRLLQRSAIHFRTGGDAVDHHGLRVPSYVGLDEMLDRVRREEPQVWGFITAGGTLWQQADLRTAA